jgi:hypothetical protein
LRTGQSAEITGVSAEGSWWQIQFSGSAVGRGWLSAKYVTAENTENVPVVQASPPPATQTPTPTPIPTSTPVLITDWRGEYFNNPHLSGVPVLVRNDVAVNFDWGTGSPGAGLPADDFSARWSRGLSFPAGTYRFYTRADDGIRLWVDGTLVIDEWHDSAPTTYSAEAYLSEGWHNLRMEYYERSGGALAQLTWERQESYPDWKAEYYDNRRLKGDPVLVRNETEIDHHWGHGSPGSPVPADNFSARWTRKVKFKSGTYLFRVRVDDGVRLWVGDELVIDSWEDGSARWIKTEHKISRGTHKVKVEYYEHWGDARFEMSWERQEEPANSAPVARDDSASRPEDTSVTINVAANDTDVDGNLDPSSATVVSGPSNGTVINNGDGTFTYTPKPDFNGSDSFSYRICDTGGLCDTATASITVTSLNDAPTVTISDPANGATFDEGEVISFSATASDVEDGDVTASLSWVSNIDGTISSGGSFSRSDLSVGVHTITATATDSGGLTGSGQVSITINPANTAPAVTISAPADSVTFTAGETINFSGTAGDVEDGDVTASLSWVSNIDGTIGSGGSFSRANLSVGVHTITASVSDSGGLTGSDQVSITVNPINMAPTVTTNAPTDGATFTAGETINFSGTASDVEDGDVTASLSWVSDIDGTIGSGGSFSRSDLSVGVHTITATATDSGGLTSSDQISIQVE